MSTGTWIVIAAVGWALAIGTLLAFFATTKDRDDDDRYGRLNG